MTLRKVTLDKEKTEKRGGSGHTEREAGAQRESLLQTDGLMDLHFIFIDRSGK